MFSGGMDSTALVYKLLTESKYSRFNIHIHHIILDNIEGRADAERNAVSNILEYFKNDYKFRKFEYSESAFSFPAVSGSFLYDTDIIGFISGYFLSYFPQVERVATGVTKSDFSDDSLGDRKKRGDNILNAFKQGASSRKYYPLITMTKQSIYNMLPADLLQLVWYCRTPVPFDDTFKCCNKCKTCKEVSQLNLHKEKGA